tara:strand:+ start:1099 stop:2016 length:918 start_codon:yes stop_codon:yes gene_type:complete
MTYFSYLPNVQVRTSSYRTNNVDPYKLAKNIFRRIKIRENLDDIILGFNQYTIKNNQRPDQVALEVYGTMSYDWLVLLTNNIINLYDEWPMSEDELERYIESEYDEDSSSVHHWVTQKVTDGRGRTLLKGDRTVSEDFSYTRPDGTAIPKDQIVRPISVYDHESEKNDFKRNIYLLRKEYINGFIEEFSTLVDYLPNDEVDNDTQVKKTKDSVQEQFISVKPTYSTNIGQSSSVEFASEADYSSRTFDVSADSISEGDVLSDGSTVVTTGVAGVSSNIGTTTNQYGSATTSSSGTGSSSGNSGGY